MTALALRHVPRGEVIQLLTWHVASARDLPGVLAWRLGQVLTAARRDQSRQVLADEDGVRACPRGESRFRWVGFAIRNTRYPA